MKALLVLLLLAVASCNTEIQEPELEFDVNGLTKCITEVAPLVPDVIEIINYIKAADWAQAATKVFDAITKVVPAAKVCINAFKKEVNLEGIFGYETYSECMARCKRIPFGYRKQKCFEECRGKL